MKHTTRPRLSRLCSAVTLALAGTYTGVSIAQPQPQTQEQLEEITVTGSRIQRDTTFATAVPVTAVTTADLASFKPGATMADQLDQLPQFFQTQSAQRGGGALFGGAGRSVIDLRAMGPQRTLVLLDGARLSPADRDGSVHIDNIPTALLSQVEVVTGGASAAYGADALAGVTNFRLNREYEGLDLSVDYGSTADSMGDNRGFTVAYGTPIGDKWHFIGSVENQSIDPIEYDPLELATPEAPPTWHRADLLERHARRLLPGLRGKEKSRWMGMRPTLPDYVPAIGRAPHHANVYCAYGHQHVGLTFAAITARHIATLMEGGSLPPDLAACDPGRFG